jgi:hypothetical protein
MIRGKRVLNRNLSVAASHMHHKGVRASARARVYVANICNQRHSCNRICCVAVTVQLQPAVNCLILSAADWLPAWQVGQHI